MPSLIRTIWVASLFLFIGGPSYANDIFWSGRVFYDHYAPYEKTFEKSPTQSSLTGWLQGEWELAPNVTASGNFVGRVIDSDTVKPIGASKDDRIRLELVSREFWLDAKSSGWQLRTGQQIIPWGKSDAINPTDFLSAKDLTIFNHDEEVKRIGHQSILLSWVPGEGTSNWSFSAVWTLVPPKSKLLLGPTMAGNSFLAFSTLAEKEFKLIDTELGIKVAYAGEGWDFDVIAFSGWDHLPILRESSRMGTYPMVKVTLVPDFRRKKGVGANISWAGDVWVWRLEGAYISTENTTNFEPVEKSDWLESVVGVERPFFRSHLRAQAQLHSKLFPSYKQPLDLDPLQAEVRKMNGLLHGEHLQQRIGGSFRLAWDPQEPTGFFWDIFALLYWSQEYDYLLQPKLEYKWTQAFNTSFGVMYFGGNDNEPLSLMKPFNSYFFEAKYFF